MSRYSSTDIDRTIQSIAKTQLGLLTLDQASRRGVPFDALAYRTRNRLLTQEFPGVFRVSSSPKTQRSRALGACLALPNGALDERWSAMIHGFPLRFDSLDHSDVAIVEPAGDVSELKGIKTRRTIFPILAQTWFGTSRTLAPGPTLVSLAQRETVITVERCLDFAISKDQVSVDGLMQWLTEHPAQRLAGRRILSALLDERSDGRVGYRSKLEMKVRSWLNDSELPPPLPNYLVPVGDEKSIEVDFAWPHRRVALEVSPFFTHGSKQKQLRDAERRRLLMVFGWRIVEANDPHLQSRCSFDPIIAALLTLLSQR